MALTRPILASVGSFDATQAYTFVFNVIGGDSVVGNTLTITNQATGVITYNQAVDATDYAHTLPANTLRNGTAYTAYVQTKNEAGELSQQSNVIQFNCYAAASLSFTNLPTGNIITAAEFEFEATYNQAQGDSVSNYIFNLYDVQGVLVSTSNVQYPTSASSPPTTLSHKFSGFADNSRYLVECVVNSVSGQQVTTGRVEINVLYEAPIITGGIAVTPNCQDGYMQGYIDWRQVPAGVDKLRVKRRRTNEFNWTTIKEFDSRERTLSMIEKPQYGINKFYAIDNDGVAIVDTGISSRYVATTADSGDTWQTGDVLSSGTPNQIVGNYAANNYSAGYYLKDAPSHRVEIPNVAAVSTSLTVRSYGTHARHPIFAAMGNNSSDGIVFDDGNWYVHNHFPKLVHPCLYQWTQPSTITPYMLCHDYDTKKIYFITVDDLINNVDGWQEAHFVANNGDNVTVTEISGNGGYVCALDATTKKVYFLTYNSNDVGRWRYDGMLPTDVGTVYGFALTSALTSGYTLNSYIVMDGSACYLLTGSATSTGRLQVIDKSTSFSASSRLSAQQNIVQATQYYYGADGDIYRATFVLDRANSRVFVISKKQSDDAIIWSASSTVPSAQDITTFTTDLDTTAHAAITVRGSNVYIRKCVVSDSGVTISAVKTVGTYYFTAPYRGYATGAITIVLNTDGVGETDLAFMAGGACGLISPKALIGGTSTVRLISAVTSDGNDSIANIAGTNKDNVLGCNGNGCILVRYEGNDTVLSRPAAYGKCATIGTKSGSDMLKVITSEDSGGSIKFKVSTIAAYNEVPVPSLAVDAYTYDGTAITPTISNYDANLMTATGSLSATNAGDYIITVSLNDKTNNRWSDGGTNDILLVWKITPAVVAIPSLSYATYEWNPIRFITPVVAYDSANVTLGGDTSKQNVGTYTLTASLKDANHQWADGTTTDKSYAWSIQKSSIAIWVSSFFNSATFTGNKTWDGTMQYSTNGYSWSTWTREAIDVNYSTNSVLWVRGIGNTKVAHFMSETITGSAYICGNMETLLDYRTVLNGGHPAMGERCFLDTFANSALNFNNYDGVTLPSTTLSVECYSGMFYNVSGLNTPPILPATALAEGCYESMFSDCSNLDSFLVLPATQLPNNCYRQMFMGCSKLKLYSTQSARYKEYRIPTTGDGVAGTGSLENMFAGTGGTFTGTPEINTVYYYDPNSNDVVGGDS